jgi:hypothetical protein
MCIVQSEPISSQRTAVHVSQAGLSHSRVSCSRLDMAPHAPYALPGGEVNTPLSQSAALAARSVGHRPTVARQLLQSIRSDACPTQQSGSDKQILMLETLASKLTELQKTIELLPSRVESSTQMQTFAEQV